MLFLVSSKRNFLFLISLTFHSFLLSYKAVVVVPVADLVTTPFSKKIKIKYHNLPLCWKSKIENCPRIHQVLFGEIVEVCDKKNDQVLIYVYNSFIKRKSEKKGIAGWTLQENVVPLKKVKHSKLPKEITFKNKNSLKQDNVVTLLEPLYFADNSLWFSAGTRFKHNPNKSTQSKFAIYILDPKTLKFKSFLVPKTKLIEYKDQSSNKKIKKFLKTLRSWINNNSGIIPYVWGGISIGKACTQNSFTKEPDNLYHKTGRYYVSEHCPKGPCLGCDCSGLVLRAAQIHGIPYFFKNTSTLDYYLKPIKSKDELQEGDLLNIQGHVMILSNKKKNKLIEARAYGQGYGKLQEIPVSEEFRGINSFDDLAKTFLEKRPLVRLKKNGKVVRVYPEFNLLKLSSCWD